MYLMSIGFLITDIAILDPLGMNLYDIEGEQIDDIQGFVNNNGTAFQNIANSTLNPSNSDGTIFDRVLLFSQGGFTAIWELLALLSGTYHFQFLMLLGIPNIFIISLQLIFGFIIAHTVISYIMGRG